MFELADSSFSARLFQFHPKPICTLEHCHKTNEGAGAAGAGMQLHGAFQSHVLRLCALQILLEALVCKSDKCLGKVGLWLINLEKYPLITLVTGTCVRHRQSIPNMVLKSVTSI